MVYLTAITSHDLRAESRIVYMLVDESQRSQYGLAHAKMHNVFPNACYIGFTRTPLMKAEKSTAQEFGEVIHTYPMRQAGQDIADKSFQVRKMKNRWGNCTKAGTISLNLELSVAPKYFIEYVIAHELYDVKEHNHGPNCYQLFTKLIPDWEQRSERLNQCVLP